MVEIGKKIASLRNNAGKTQQELADFLGVDVKKIGRIERGETKTIKNNDLKSIAIFLNTSINDLLENKMSVSQNQNVSKSSVSRVSNLSVSDSSMFPTQNKLSLNSVPQSENVSLNMSISDSPMFADMIAVPFFKDSTASAGFGVMNFETEVAHIPLSKPFLLEVCGVMSLKGLSILQCSGDSMQPTIQNGDYLLIQEEQNIKEGSIYVVEYNNEIFVKRIHKYPKIRLLSDNRDYLPIEIGGEENIKIMAKVITSISIKKF